MQKFRQLLTENDVTKKEKAGLSVIIGFAFSFCFFFFGMLYIFYSNYSLFMISSGRALTAAVIMLVSVWAGLSGLLYILPGKFFTGAASLTGGLIIAGYMQSSFLNGLVNTGALTGDAVNWHTYTKHTLLNLMIWLIILILPAAVKYFAPVRIWKQGLIIACALLTGMQGAALLGYCISNREQMQYEPGYYLSREGAYEVSSVSNIIVIVIDRLDYAYIEAIRKEDPGFFDRLDGFTEFTNAAVAYEATFPSATFITTGVEYDFVKSQAEYFDRAWSESQFIKTLKDAGYSMKYHMDGMGYIYDNHNQLLNIADNIKEGIPIPALRSVTANLLTLSAYRHSPMALKPAFWMPRLVYKTIGDVTERDFVTYNDPLFMELLAENGLTVQSEKGSYLYLHLYGAHAPYTMDESGLPDETSDVTSQTKGCFNILYRYMDEMKRLGVYEKSTIVILGDHGDLYYHVGFFVKPAGSAEMPLKQNNAPVSITDNLFATIMKSEGLAHEQYGVSAFDVEPGIPGERYVARWSRTGRDIEFYKITGHINNRNRDSWELSSSFEYSADLVVNLPADTD